MQLVPRRSRRNRWLLAVNLVVVLTLFAILLGRASGGGQAAGGNRTNGPPPSARRPLREARPPAPPRRLDPDWRGDGHAVTLAFGGDIHFPAGTSLGERLADDPPSALGPTVPELFAGADLTMANFESALTDGTCPDNQSKQYVFYAPATAVEAFRGARITLVTEANNHGEDCGPAGLQMTLEARRQTGYPIIGIGSDMSEAFRPYETTIHGQRIAIIAATQVIDSDLQKLWTATSTQAGLASAYDVDSLIAAVEGARRRADTVVVYLHWGTQLQGCPNPLQEPLAQLLVKAGADIVVGTHAHVLLGGGYLGSAYVDYGLGNFAFYNNSPPENASGSLLVTATGRHIDQVRWRPAVIVDDLPEPLQGTEATEALAAWNQARGCTDATAAPGAPMATTASETSLPPAAQVAPLSTDAD